MTSLTAFALSMSRPVPVSAWIGTCSRCCQPMNVNRRSLPPAKRMCQPCRRELSGRDQRLLTPEERSQRARESAGARWAGKPRKPLSPCRTGDHSGCQPDARHGVCSKCGKAILLGRSSAPPDRRRCRDCWSQRAEWLTLVCANAECGREFARKAYAVANDHPCCSQSCSTKVAIQHGLMPNSLPRTPGVTRKDARKARCRTRFLRHAQTWDGIPDEEILERDGWRCQIPGCKRRPIRKDAQFPHPRSKSIDHIVPLSLGGDDVAANKRAAHLVCNVARGNRMAEEQLPLFGSVREAPLITRIEEGRVRVRKQLKRRRSCDCTGSKHKCFSRVFIRECSVCGRLAVHREPRKTVCSEECRAERAAITARQRNDRLGEARGWPRGRGSYNAGRDPWNKVTRGAAA